MDFLESQLAAAFVKTPAVSLDTLDDAEYWATLFDTSVAELRMVIALVGPNPNAVEQLFAFYREVNPSAFRAQ